MRVGSLFSGYGGLDMAVGGDLAWYSEIEPAACKVLAAHHPGVPNIGDVTAVDWTTVESVDVLTGGYPCQPFSHAGKRKGRNDERHLWPYVCAAIDALRPGLVVLENVRGHLSLGFGDVIADLSRVGYDARWGVVRAADAGAPHQRARIFIVAYPADASQRRSTALRSVGASEAGSAAGPDGGRQHPTSTDATHIGHQWDRTARDWWTGPTDGGESAADAFGIGRERRDDPGSTDGERGRLRPGASGHSLLAADADDSGRYGRPCGAGRKPGGRATADGCGDVDLGRYGPAVHRWEHVLQRGAPAPTVPGRTGRPRLNPQFVEWMMGLPAGHVTGHGLSAAQELKMLGNGVVPQQAALALRLLGVAA